MNCEVLIVGGGIYGLYSARLLAERGNKVVLIEMDSSLFSRASYVNQARIHNGYHYPRSFETAFVSHKYYDKFKVDFKDAINDKFNHIYAVSNKDSLTSDEKFNTFCEDINIPHELIDSNEYFLKDTVSNAYKVEECSFDFKKVSGILTKDHKFEILLNSTIKSVKQEASSYTVVLSTGTTIDCGSVINTTYSSINQINDLFGYNFIDMKYELCEMILCNPPTETKDLGITIVDGHYFSIMPFGLQGHHSLYSVQYSVHQTSWDGLPKFSCQGKNNTCTDIQLNNCNNCHAKPKTAFSKMQSLANEYLKHSNIEYLNSIYTVKVVSKNAEQNDSRLVSIECHNDSPVFMSIFSGKISSIYEIDKTLIDVLT